MLTAFSPFPVIGVNARVNAKVFPKQLQVCGFKEQFYKDQNSLVFSAEQKAPRWKKIKIPKHVTVGIVFLIIATSWKGGNPATAFNF